MANGPGGSSGSVPRASGDTPTTRSRTSGARACTSCVDGGRRMASLTMITGGSTAGEEPGDLAELGQHARPLLAVGDQHEHADVAAR